MIHVAVGRFPAPSPHGWYSKCLWTYYNHAANDVMIFLMTDHKNSTFWQEKDFRMDFSCNLHFVLADDHALVRQSVKMMLEVAFEGCSVSEARDFASALAAVSERKDALLLIDLEMPGMDGMESLRALRSTFPDLRMAVLSGDDSRSAIMGAVTAGANGYIPKASSAEELIYAIQTIASGKVYTTNKISKSGPVTI